MNIFVISSFIAFITCELIATFVYLKNPASKINRSFAIETFFIGLWTLFPFVTGMSYSREEALHNTRFIYIAAILVPPTFLFFVFNLINIAHIEKEKNILKVFYVISGVFVILSFSPFLIRDVTPASLTYVIVPGIAYHLFFFFFAVTIIFGYIRIFLKYKDATGFKKNQLMYVLTAFIIAGIAGFIHFLSAYGIEEMFPHDFLVILFTAIVAYSIVKYRVLDVNIAFKKTMAYSLAAGLLMGIFVIFVLTATQLFSTFAHVDSFKISVVAALAIALLFNPLRIKIQTLIDKLFYKKTYDYYATVRKVSHELASIFYLRKVYDFIGDAVFSTLGLRNIYLLTAVHYGRYNVVYHTSYAETEGKKGGLTVKGRDNGTEEKTMIDDDSAVVRLLNATKDI
ncbi:hypothetical protein HZA75_03325, partial [Candidatus Roizmanbacteria bacterium]|nr:hypothetical protein [Candidatus Roizmanbacteria bacterium]